MTAATVEPAFNVFGTSIADLFEPNLATIPQVIAIKDDTIRFSALNKAALNGAYTWKVYTKFGSEQDQQGAWKFNSNQSQIIFTSTSGTETIFDIVSLESNKMTVKSKMANPIDPADRTEYKVTSTFKAK